MIGNWKDPNSIIEPNFPPGIAKLLPSYEIQAQFETIQNYQNDSNCKQDK